ncbi:MAG: ECF transporter S component [Epulopiscium sp. Nele67-Bin001]|nr:MAG: ECF transporter S component [Epulopiscium sp. Nele67-Bin001]
MRTNTRALTLLGVLLAVITILAFTPLGFIRIGAVSATTVHIPVIIGSVFLGPIGGAILGLAFGVTSMINSTITPLVTSFIFSPFVTIGEMSGNIWSVVVACGPRILIGIVSYYTYAILNKFHKIPDTAKFVATGLAGSMTNTIFVLSGIYIFFGPEYAAAIGVESTALLAFIMAIVGTNGVPEAIVAAVITTMACKVLKMVFKQDFRLKKVM